MKNHWPSCCSLILVVALHAGAIGLALWIPSPKTQELVLPTVQGIIIPAPAAENVQMPSARETPPPVEPPPPEPEKPKPKPKKPKPTPKPEPVVEAPPSERAISREEIPVEESTPPAPQPVSTPLAEKEETLGAPVTPPREDAHQKNNPRPAYPSLSRRLREQGTVLLEILIEPDGTVSEVRIKESSGFKRLDDTAMRAVKQWTYTPARRGNEPIAYWYLQPLEFSLH